MGTPLVTGSLRMMGDRILLKPLEWDASKIIIAVRHGRAVRGEVIAVGPGCYPKKYKAGPKGPRSLMDYSKRFQRTELKPGDIVELGGLNVFDGQGYMFPEVLIGTERHIIVQEADVAVVRDDLKAA
jgi:co-chaperonin GroES (HSP10)